MICPYCGSKRYKFYKSVIMEEGSSVNEVKTYVCKKCKRIFEEGGQILW